MSNTGYMTQVISEEWIRDCFDIQTQGVANGDYRVLVVDGASSHFSYGLLQFAKANKIIVLCLPPNCTHILQCESLLYQYFIALIVLYLY